MTPVLQFRVDDGQKASIDAAVERSGKTRSEFLRDLALAASTSAGAPVSGAAGTSRVTTPPPGPDSPRSTPPAPRPSPAAAPAAPIIVHGDQALPPDPGTCPDCGAPDGRHHGFCVQVTGEEPVTGTEAPIDPVAHVAETREGYVARRVAEQVADGEDSFVAGAVAEAEWRRLHGGGREPAGPPPAAQQPGRDPAPAGYAPEPCPGCGTVKLPTAQCRDCGARPTII